jgi:hypothetical protein
MKYFVLLSGYGELAAWDALTADEQEAQMAQLGAFDEACAARPGVEILSQAPLGDGSTATTLRTRGGELTITDARSPKLPSRSAASTSSMRPSSIP